MFLGMLIQGCGGERGSGEAGGTNSTEVAIADTNRTDVAQQKAGEGEAPVPPTFEPPTSNAPVVTNAVVEAVTNAVPAPAPVAGKQYAVLRGDSFYKIAKANHVSLKALTEANPGVDSGKLKIGQVVQIPASAGAGSAALVPSTTAADSPAKTASAAKAKARGQYVVKSGDSLGRIARAHHTTVSAIKSANGLTSDRIVAGQTLKLPESRIAGASSARG